MKTAKLYLVFFFLSNLVPVLGQSVHPDPRFNIEKVMRSVASKVIDDTSFEIVNKETNESYKNSENLPITSSYIVKSPYNEWRYYNGVLNIAFLKLAETFKDEQYKEYVKKNVSFGFDHDNYFRKQYEAGVCGDGMSQKFRLNMLDDCGAIGAGIISNYPNDPKKRYRDYINTAADYIMNKEHRLSDGTLSRTPEEMKVWADDMYMSIPFLARMGVLTGDQKYFDEAVNQVVLFNEHLWNEETKLFYHIWYDDTKQHGVAHWGRANGWTLMAQVDLLERLPKDHPKRAVLISLLTRQIVGLSRYQDTSGLWHQLLDKESSFLETSCTAMFTYAIAKAINKGWIHSRYAYIAAQGWRGLETKITPDGQIEDVSQGTAESTAAYYYYQRKRPLNDIHGIGAVILAGCEMIKLYEKGIPYQW